MELRSTLKSLLFFLVLRGICTGLVQENCKNYELQFERVYTVPGDVAMLNSTLLSSEVFNFTSVPYNITWYDPKTGQELSNQTGRIVIHGETLWFLNITLDDAGEYVSVVRTPTQCYKQATKLVVDERVAGECGRPMKAHQIVTKGVNDKLSCPLKDYMNKLDSYNITSSIQWYKGCDPIVDGTHKYNYITTTLLISELQDEDTGFYTCTLTFTLGGKTGSVSETIDASVREQYVLVPQVHEPANEVIKAEIGSNFTKRCLVFVPGVGGMTVDIFWWAGNKLIWENPSDQVHTLKRRKWSQRVPHKGVWLERHLIFPELREEDFNVNYTCRAYSPRGTPECYFTLERREPNIILPIGLVFCGVTLLFIIAVVIYYLFKVDIVLWFRRTFPVLYANKDLDGKLYDAYVAFPPPGAVGYSDGVESFAIHMLPEVLEKACDYKLFIAGRDCLPGQAVMDSVEENIQASRRLLLLYTASTFTSKRHTSSTSSTNNNNISKDCNISENTEESETKDSSISFVDIKEDYQDTRQQLECVAAMHRALLERSLKVILVELEEITPAQLALFPESVRHLRKKQGAVCWWKSLRPRRRWKTCTRTGGDEEKGGEDTRLSPPLSPSFKYWKEIRYHMPVRGKRAMYPEKTEPLN